MPASSTVRTITYNVQVPMAKVAEFEEIVSTYKIVVLSFHANNGKESFLTPKGQKRKVRLSQQDRAAVMKSMAPSRDLATHYNVHISTIAKIRRLGEIAHAAKSPSKKK